MTAPAINSVRVTSLPEPGTPATLIHGSGFTGATAVVFGSTPSSSFVALSDTDISAVSPIPFPAGTDVTITVTTPSGSTTAALTVGTPGTTVRVTSFTTPRFLGSASSQGVMTTLQAGIGDYCYRTDLGQMFYLIATPATSAASWSASNPLDKRYSPIADRLMVIADNGYSSGVNNTSTSTAGTGEYLFTVGVAASGVTAEWEHWYNVNGVDTDPAGSISFNASLRVVSSTNPGTVTGTIYRITFNGRTTATLDPGGKIVGDVVGVSVSPGDIVAVRTFLSSGTAYPPRQIIGGLGTGWGGFTATTDLTAPGSAAVAGAIAWAFGPSSLLGRQTGSAPSVLLVGDSICAGAYDGFYGITGGLVPGFEYYGGGGAFMRALSGKAGVINTARLGDEAQWFAGTNGSFRRLANAQRCNSAIIEYGHNDLGTSITAAVLETYLLQIANQVRSFGISIVYLTTLTPNTTSTDGFATTANQTTQPSEATRVQHNTWVRAGCPIDPTTLAPVTVGTSGALLAGSFGHPITGIFDTGAQVETSLNSGLWLPCSRITTGSVTVGQNTTLTSSAANFQSATQETGGDRGSTYSLLGAGPSGATMFGWITSVTNSTTTVMLAQSPGLGTTVTNAQLNMGITTLDGTHPSTRGHYLMAKAINPAVL